MARTKSTARKVLVEKPPDTRKPPVFKKRKFTQGVACLIEIRRAQKALDYAIRGLPFQRLVRQIAAEYKIDLLWQRSALACIHEAAEDFLIEMFGDAFILAAHAHRVTLMDKDLITLRRVRYRFSKLLEPLPFNDIKQYNILNIPPWRKPKEQADKEELKDRKGKVPVKHTRTTEEEAEREELKNLATDLHDKEVLATQGILGASSNGFHVRTFQKDDIRGRDEYITMDSTCISILRVKIREINDTILYVGLR